MAAAAGTVIACHIEDEFDAQMANGKDAGKLVIIDFMTPYCPGCKEMAPVYAKCANKYPAAVFLQVDVNELEEVADKYDIDGIPTFCFIRNGETLDSFATTNADDLEDAIKMYY